jgi:hypothetical protein
VKLLKLFIFILAIVALCFTSCKKESNSKVSVGSDKMSATIGNKNYDLTLTEITKVTHGDTVTITISGITKDSTLKVGIALINQVGIFVKKYYFKGNPFSSDTTKPIIYGGIVHIFKTTDTTYISANDSTKGYVNILEYNENTDILGSYSFTAQNMDDSTKVISVKGQFNASLVDPQTKIPDLPIAFGKMTARIDKAVTNFTAVAANINLYGLYTLNINGTENKESIVLQFVNFKPTVGSKYKIDSTQLNKDVFVKASYIKDTITYLADGSKGTSGEIDIVKMTTKSVQGKFYFTGIDIKKPGSSANITEGMFNARFKNYSK